VAPVELAPAWHQAGLGPSSDSAWCLYGTAWTWPHPAPHKMAVSWPTASFQAKATGRKRERHHLGVLVTHGHRNHMGADKFCNCAWQQASLCPDDEARATPHGARRQLQARSTQKPQQLVDTTAAVSKHAIAQARRHRQIASTPRPEYEANQALTKHDASTSADTRTRAAARTNCQANLGQTMPTSPSPLR